MDSSGEAGNAGIAQLVERNLAKVEVESSRLFSRSKFVREASASLFSWASAAWWVCHCRAVIDASGHCVHALPGLRCDAGVRSAAGAPMVKLVDTADLKSAAFLKRGVPVRPRLGAPLQINHVKLQRSL